METINAITTLAFILGIGRVVLLVFVSAMYGFFGPYGCFAEPGPYEVTIERVANGAFEEGLITAAETACALDYSEGPYCSPPIGPESEPCRWWCDDFDGVLSPYALTAEALAYYQERVESFRQMAEENPHAVGMYNCILTYDATVKQESVYDEHSDVYVVLMNLRYTEVCGSLCGHFLWANRTVVFDALGQLLEIDGDGTATRAIS